MKHKIFKTLLAVVAATMTFFAEADTDTVNGIKWTYFVKNGEASIGGGHFSSPAIPESTSGAITIPSTLGGYPVTSIGDVAFYGCSSLTSVIRGRGACPPLASLKSLFNNSQRVFKFFLLLNGAERKTQE